MQKSFKNIRDSKNIFNTYFYVQIIIQRVKNNYFYVQIIIQNVLAQSYPFLLLVQHIRFRFLLATDFLYKVVVVVFDFFTVPSMPKAQKLSANKGAVLARERREKEKENSQYSEALKEFLKLKYNHIIAEFNPMYEALKNNRPTRLKYTNTNEFRLWQKQEIARLMCVQQQEQPQAVQSEDEQPQAVQSEDEQPQAVQSEDEQSEDEQPQAVQSEDEQPQAVQSEDEQPHAVQSEDEQPQPVQQVFEEQQLVNDLANLYDEVVGNNNDHVNLYEEVVGNNDEGIELDLWEELQGDIEEFDYHLEVELDQYLQ